MNSSTQIIGIKSLLGALATALILTIMLGSMVASRVSLLQDGKQIVLKTRPVDPRDLLRGYYVRLNYDISRIAPHDLSLTPEEVKNYRAFKRHSLIFVKLRRDKEGFWSPISLHHTHPAKGENKEGKPDNIFIRGRVLYGSCHRQKRIPLAVLFSIPRCKISIRYGIEKFFAQKKRARKLEDFSRQTTPEMDELDKRIRSKQKDFNKIAMALRSQNRKLNKTKTIQRLSTVPELAQLRRQLTNLRQQQRKRREQNNKAMAKRFAVIVRVDKKTGEAAISGLQLDGRQIYEEPLF